MSLVRHKKGNLSHHSAHSEEDGIVEKGRKGLI